jgi:Xaa-Pro aminopeptidase
VHEGPQSISPSAGKGANTVIEPGMVISDEPALYREGEYGIRCENLLLCRDDETTSFGRFLAFDTLSLCHFDRKLIDVSLLGNEAKEMLNAYHSVVFSKLAPFLDEGERRWLKEKTLPL